MFTANQTIDSLGWIVFVDQPLEEAFAPLYTSMLRTTLLLTLGLLISIVASVLLARRMVGHPAAAGWRRQDRRRRARAVAGHPHRRRVGGAGH